MESLVGQILYNLQFYGVFLEMTKESGENWLKIYPDMVNFIDEENRGYMKYQLEYLSYTGEFCQGDYHFLKEMVLALRTGCNIEPLKDLDYLLIRETRLFKRDTGIDYVLKEEDTVESIKLYRLQTLDKDPFYVWDKSLNPTRIALTAYKAKAKGFSPYLIMGLFHPAVAENLFQCLCYSKKIGFDLEPYLLDPQNRYLGTNKRVYRDTYVSILNAFKAVLDGRVDKKELQNLFQVIPYCSAYNFIQMLNCLPIFKKASFVVKHIENINAILFKKDKYYRYRYKYNKYKAIMSLLREMNLSDVMDILEHCYGYIINLEHLNCYKGLDSAMKKQHFLEDFEVMKPFLPTIENLKIYRISNPKLNIFIYKNDIPDRYYCLMFNRTDKILEHFKKIDKPELEAVLQYYVSFVNCMTKQNTIANIDIPIYYINKEISNDLLNNYYHSLIEIEKYDHFQLFIDYMEKGYNINVLKKIMNFVNNDISAFINVLDYVNKEWSCNFVCEILETVLPVDLFTSIVARKRY